LLKNHKTFECSCSKLQIFTIFSDLDFITAKEWNPHPYTIQLFSYKSQSSGENSKQKNSFS